MSLLYQAYLLKRKKGAREENKADLFDNTVHYWGEGEANNGSYLPAVGVGGVGQDDSLGASPTKHTFNWVTTDPQFYHL